MKFLHPEDYQEKCSLRFSYYKDEICKLVPKCKVEHIGASSIPNLISKGDLDIFIGVNKDEFENTITVLHQLNFQEKTGSLRTDELCMLESKNENVAFQVVVNGSKYEFFITFRDILINNPDLIKEYNLLKETCIGYSQEKYRKVKSEFIENVLSST